MIIYSNTKAGFISDVKSNVIDTQVDRAFVRETGRHLSPQEVPAVRNSMQFMRNVIDNESIPGDAGIAIEYMIPQTSKRIDFIITGLDKDKKKNAIVVELKQWEHVEKVETTDMDGVVKVKTYTGGAVREVVHPSYQVLSYAIFLEDYNESIQEKEIKLHPSVYLHNYTDDNVISDKQYKDYIEKAPLFFKEDTEKLQNFIKQFVKYGDNKAILYEIENGKIKPSKALADSLANMLKGNKEFYLIDEQKVVYERALQLAKIATAENKQVFIVEGGPGTGKSVVAINLLAEITKQRRLVQYVTKNSAPRKVFVRKLAGDGFMTQAQIRNLFRGAGSYKNAQPNTFDVLIVDEAHRMIEKDRFGGKNQIMEVINAAKCSIFFIDENQKVTLQDIGSKEEIKKWAHVFGAEVTEMELASQFRCNGSDGYLAWLDNVLQIRETANYSLEDINYDFRVFDDPQKMHNEIIKKNKINNKSRVVAGYTWDWITKKPENAHLFDIEIGDYKARWNLTKHDMSWIINPESVTEVGCIHTCQGLELDYVGVIIGPDLIVRDGKVITDYTKRAKTDSSLKGIKKRAQEHGEEYAQKLADTIIKNTYRTLMTRGMKGCFIYSEDEETRKYFERMFKKDKIDDGYGAVSDGVSVM